MSLVVPNKTEKPSIEVLCRTASSNGTLDGLTTHRAEVASPVAYVKDAVPDFSGQQAAQFLNGTAATVGTQGLG